MHEKYNFTEVSKNVVRYRSENNFNDQNNYVRLSSMIKIAAKSFDVLSINLKLEIFHIIIFVI